MSAHRTHYEPSPLEQRANAFATIQTAMDRRARRRSRILLTIVLLALLGPMLLVAALKAANTIVQPVRVITIETGCGRSQVVDSL